MRNWVFVVNDPSYRDVIICPSDFSYMTQVDARTEDAVFWSKVAVERSTPPKPEVPSEDKDMRKLLEYFSNHPIYVLDDLVLERATRRGSRLNQRGLEDQLKFLLKEGFTPDTLMAKFPHKKDGGEADEDEATPEELLAKFRREQGGKDET